MRWYAIVALCLLGAAAYISPAPHPTGSRLLATKWQIDAMELALEAYRSDTGAYPDSALGLRALREEPAGVRGWKGPYLPKPIPLDPWGRPYVYSYPGTHGERPEIVSLGRDGRPDVVSWTK